MTEAMADMEEGRPARWLGSLRTAWERKAEERSTRLVTVPHRHDHNLRERLGEQHYRGNKTTTTKYNALTFLPKSLFEQYRRVANVYFTLVAALSLTPYSPVRPWTTFLPLGIVLGVAMIKEAVEDWKRHRQDVEVNKRDVMVFDGPQNKFVTRQWKDVRVGDIITVLKDEYFPADLLFLSAESDEGLCYNETMNLDGETNLKIKKAMDETKGLREESMSSLHACIHCEPPNSRLYQFTGNLEVGPPFVQEVQTLPISPASILLRGCSLRNTARIFGLVIYAGHDTKIFMNSTKAPSKRSAIERTVDKIIFCMFALLFTMCVTGCTYFAIWTRDNMAKHWYLGAWGDEYYVPNEYNPDKPALVGATNFVTAFILYGYLIPISLYVSMEMVKIVQSMVFIAQDRDMYHAESDTPAVARTSNLNEELGMVTTVLSDKTGTLTRNVMEFFKCSIGGVAYGSGITEIERANAQRKGITLPAQVEDTPFREAFFNFYDDRLMDTEWAEQPNRQITEEFFRLLALCNTVIPDGPSIPAKMRYEAESPDESALVVAAKVFGFFFFKRSNTTMWLRERTPEGEREVEYEVLNILEFNSTRKRMSVIVRTPEDRIMLYCKGADTVIYERLDNSHPLNAKLKDTTLNHMEDFGSAGLRTLCLSYTELDRTFYDEWQERFITAKTSLEDRDAKVEAVGEEIEKNLILLGCTAIEDKLQEGVPECIRTLARAGIKLWVLTGDKMETAINIAYACSLITDEMTQFQVTGASQELDMLEASGKWEEATRVAHERMRSQLNKVLQEQKEEAEKRSTVQHALVIDGKALLYALSPRLKDLFLQVATRCKAVVCCRVSPLQKAQVTALVKSMGDITLAIGDGANDVGMIQKAHIGVGISGQEGMQAVMASDFAIAQFRFLTPLLLVHGRLSYKRITRMINFFFYKNLLFGVTIFTFNAFALFSGQPIYNDFYMTLFNVVFTVAGPLVVGWFDRDVDKEWGLRYPHLYLEGQKNIYFNVRAILGWLATALLHAGLIMSFVLLGANAEDIDRPRGNAWTLGSNGVMMFTVVVMTVHFQLAVVLDQWTWLHHLSIWGSILLWFLFMYIFGQFPITLSGDLYELMSGVVSNHAPFWLFLILLPPLCAMLTFFYKEMERQLHPAQYQIVQEIAKREARGELTDNNPDKARHRSVMQKATRLLSRVQHHHHHNGSASRRSNGGGGSPGSPGGLQVLRGGHKRSYSGYVPSYDSRSRVFDAAELRNAALQAGYSIDSQPSVDRPSPGLQLSGRRPSLQTQLQSRSSDAAVNPVLQSLDKEFVKEPRRHKRSISVDTATSSNWQDAVLHGPLLTHGLIGVGNGTPAHSSAGSPAHSPFADVSASAAPQNGPSSTSTAAANGTRNMSSSSATRPGQGSEAVPPVASVGGAAADFAPAKAPSRLGPAGRVSGSDVQLQPVRPPRMPAAVMDGSAQPEGGRSGGGAAP